MKRKNYSLFLLVVTLFTFSCSNSINRMYEGKSLPDDQVSKIVVHSQKALEVGYFYKIDGKSIMTPGSSFAPDEVHVLPGKHDFQMVYSRDHILPEGCETGDAEYTFVAESGILYEVGFTKNGKDAPPEASVVNTSLCMFGKQSLGFRKLFKSSKVWIWVAPKID